MGFYEIGDRLRKRREELGLTLQDVQSETKIRQRYLEALEAGDDSILPGEVYTKGFLRIYANFLGLDGELLVEEYNLARGEASKTPTKTQTTRQRPRQPRWRTRRTQRIRTPAPVMSPPPLSRSSRRRRPRPVLAVAVLVMLLLITLIGGWLLFAVVKGELSDLWNRDAEPSNEDVDTEPEAPESATESVPPLSPPDPAETEEESSEVTVTVADQPERGILLYRISGADTILVEVHISRPSWVRVTADGNVIEEGTLQAGASRVWEAAEELRVRAGYPPGMEVTVNNQVLGVPSDLSPLTLLFRREPATPNSVTP